MDQDIEDIIGDAVHVFMQQHPETKDGTYNFLTVKRNIGFYFSRDMRKFLEGSGLSSAYRELAQRAMADPELLAGFFYYTCHPPPSYNEVATDYTTPNGNEIQLTEGGIVSHLLREYIPKGRVIRLLSYYSNGFEGQGVAERDCYRGFYEQA